MDLYSNFSSPNHLHEVTLKILRKKAMEDLIVEEPVKNEILACYKRIFEELSKPQLKANWPGSIYNKLH